MVDKVWRNFQTQLKKIKSLDGLEEVEIKFLGRKGQVNKLFQQLAKIPASQKRRQGQAINELKQKITKALAKKKEQLQLRLADELAQENFDVTQPGREQQLGHLHPITQMKWEIGDIFRRMGFEIFEPQEVSDDYNNFGALNIPAGHPARDLWDTFWTREGYIPITHTSSMQNWIYRHRRPPIRAVVIGRCFRHEATDASHEHTFHQIEGVYVDENVTVANLIETMRVFLSAFYGKEMEIKVRPSYFPFVEPGLEIAMKCVFCNGKGCSVCKNSGWIEILGAGEIHPRVLREGGIDPEKYSGFAWGLGLERLIMLRYGIEDVRRFHRGDLRFLRQF